MAAPPSAYKDRQFLAVIGDEVGQVHGAGSEFLLIYLAGLGNWTAVSRYWCTNLPCVISCAFLRAEDI